ncbi:hypothetical protein LTS10_004566 [Elasticomyces elasticus]|nr:hypothetical protein LTS10_004566 [Elasticomyces elasticus]
MSPAPWQDMCIIAHLVYGFWHSFICRGNYSGAGVSTSGEHPASAEYGFATAVDGNADSTINLDGEVNDGENNDGKVNDGENNDGENNDGEVNDGENNDGENNDGESHNLDDISHDNTSVFEDDPSGEYDDDRGIPSDDEMALLHYDGVSEPDYDEVAEEFSGPEEDEAEEEDEEGLSERDEEEDEEMLDQESMEDGENSKSPVLPSPLAAMPSVARSTAPLTPPMMASTRRPATTARRMALATPHQTSELHWDECSACAPGR